MGNSLGAVKKKIKVKTKNKVGTTSRRNILYEKVSGAKGTGFFCGTRLMVSVFSITFYLLLGITGCSGVACLSKSGLEVWYMPHF